MPSSLSWEWHHTFPQAPAHLPLLKPLSDDNLDILESGVILWPLTSAVHSFILHLFITALGAKDEKQRGHMELLFLYNSFFRIWGAVDNDLKCMELVTSLEGEMRGGREVEHGLLRVLQMADSTGWENTVWKIVLLQWGREELAGSRAWGLGTHRCSVGSKDTTPALASSHGGTSVLPHFPLSLVYEMCVSLWKLCFPVWPFSQDPSVLTV